MKVLILGLIASTIGMSADLPENAVPGKCYTKITMPAKVEQDVKKITIKPEVTSYKLIPAKFDWDWKEVVVKEGYETYKIVPPSFEKTTDSYEFTPSYEKLGLIPAKFKSTVETLTVRNSGPKWKASKGDGVNTGGLLCLLDDKPVVKNFKTMSLTNAPEVTVNSINAKAMNFNKTVVKNPARVEKITVPAVTKKVKVRRLVSEAKKVPFTIPAQTKEVLTSKIVSPSKTLWKEVLCRHNTTASVMKKIQSALQQAGFEAGPQDGILGSQTAQAIRAFQRKKGLPVGGLTIETIDALGVNQ